MGTTETTEAPASAADLEAFERKLERCGCAVAPNGACYALREWADGRMAVERTWRGEADFVVRGYYGNPFETRDAALYWAVADGRHEMPGVRPISDRRVLV